MPDKSLIGELEDAYAQMLSDYVGGLSNTSNSKFSEINEVFRKHLNLAGDKDVYCVGSGKRPGNIEVRLNQGLRSSIHTVLGVAFIKPEQESHVQPKSDSAVVTVKTFLNKGKGKYDSILIVAEVDEKPVPTRLISYSDSPVRQRLESLLSDTDGFRSETIERPAGAAAGDAALSESAALNIESWKIPDAPKTGNEFPIQRLIEGCPGSGKSYRLDHDASSADRVIRTIFHPEFGYADFVGYLSPETAFKVEEPTPVYRPELPGTPQVFYSYCYGPLLEAYVLAVLNPEHRVILIIEELSRAPASLVFGDTLQLLDRVSEKESGPGLPPPGFSRYEIQPKGEIKRLLESLEACPKHTQPGSMRFPANLFIWATMNRADQNARQLDTAFLRRWKREHISHDMPGVYDDMKVTGYREREFSWGQLRKAINVALVKAGATEDKFVGPYFLAEEALQTREQVADDLLAYIWYDVLREDGSDIMPGVATFADIRREWIEGSLDFPPGLGTE